MANVLVVDDAFAGSRSTVIATGRQTLPVEAVDSDTIAPTWATVLVAGATSGGTNPVISAGDALAFDTSATVSVAGGALVFRIPSMTRFQVATTYVRVSVPSLEFAPTIVAPVITQSGTGSPGENLTIQPQTGAVAQNGGSLILDTGAPGAGGTAGDVLLRSSDPSGRIRIRYPNGAVDAITVDSSGLAFWGRIPAVQPSIVGAKGGNVALANLLTALDSMGLIVDDTT